MMSTKNILSFLLVALVVGVTTTSCSKKKRKPGSIYAPDMTYSRAYETYTSNPNFANDLTNRKPVTGAVSRDGYATPEYKEADSQIVYALSNPLEMNESNLAEGKRKYNIYCAPCHGVGLDGNGHLYESGKYPLAPANLKTGPKAQLSTGQYYYTILFGKNLMGSYSAQLDEKSRWQVVGYIKNAQGGSTDAANAETDKANADAEATTEGGDAASDANANEEAK